MKIGYARTSPNEQNILMQVRALKGAGADEIFVDEGFFSTAVVRPAWADALGTLKAGDQLVIWSLDRMAGSRGELINQLHSLGEAGIGFVSLRDRIDSTDKTWQLFYHFVRELHRFNNQMLHERRAESLANEGPHKPMGRPPLIAEAQWQDVKHRMSIDSTISAAQVAKLLGVSRQAIHQRLKREKQAR